MKTKSHSRWVLLASLIAAFLFVSACENLPGVNQIAGTQVSATASPAPGQTSQPPTPTPLPTPDLDDVNLPPDVVSFFPETQYELEPNTELALFITFSQPMNKESVEAALVIQPELPGTISWDDDLTARYVVPGLPAGATYQVLLTNTALSSDGIPIQKEVNAYVKVRDDLHVTHVTPVFGDDSVRTDAMLRFTFNRPVVPDECVGAVQSDIECPELPLHITPSVPGEGYWTSPFEYAFIPLKGWRAGQSYVVDIAAGLLAVDGASLLAPYQHEFTVVAPQVVDIVASGDSSQAPLDAVIVMRFNTAMDVAATSDSINLVTDTGTAVAGTGVWSDGGAVFTYTPLESLQPQTTYIVSVGNQARASTSMPLTNPQAFAFTTIPLPALQSITPEDGSQELALTEPVRISFAGLMDEASLDSRVQVTSELGIEDVYSVFDADTGLLTLNWDKQPQTEYCVNLESNAEDVYGNVLEQGVHACFVTSDSPELFALSYPGTVIYLDDVRNSYINAETHNVDAVSFELYQLTAVQFASGAILDGESVRSWREDFDIIPNQTEQVSIALRRLEGVLPTGYYGLYWESTGGSGSTTIAVVDTHLQMTVMPDEALIWASDIRSTQPISLTTVQLLNQDGLLIAGGTTNEQGLVRIPLSQSSVNATRIMAYLGEAGSERFGVVQAEQAEAVGLVVGASENATATDGFHTSLVWLDRDVYASGDAVYLGGLVRSYVDWHFVAPAASLSPHYVIRDASNVVRYSAELELTKYGTFNNTLHLEQALPAGRYTVDILLSDGDTVPSTTTAFVISDDVGGKQFTIELDDAYPRIYLGDEYVLTAQVLDCAGRAVSGSEMTWRLYSPELGIEIAAGDGNTDVDGFAQVPITLPETLDTTLLSETWVLEVIAKKQDRGMGLLRIPVDVRAADLRLDIDTPVFVEGSGRRIAVSVLVSDFDGAAVTDLPVTVRLLTCEEPSYVNDVLQCGAYNIVATQSEDVTGSDGIVATSFTSPTAGYYKIEAVAVDDEGRSAVNSSPLIVTDSARIFASTSGILHPIANQASYTDGDTAKILIPTADAGPFEVFVMLSRGGVISTQRYTFDQANPIIQIPMIQGYAPFINVGITLVRSMAADSTLPGLTYGEITLAVQADVPALDFQITSHSETVTPGGIASLQITPVNQDGGQADAETTVFVLPASSYFGAINQLPELPVALYDKVTNDVVTVHSWNASENRHPASKLLEGGVPAFTSCMSQESILHHVASTQVTGDSQVDFTFTAPCDNDLYMTTLAVSADMLYGRVTKQLTTVKALHLNVDMPDRLVVGDQVEISAHIWAGNEALEDLTVSVASDGILIPEEPLIKAVDLENDSGEVSWLMDVVEQSQERADLTFTLADGSGNILATRTYTIGGEDGVPVYSNDALNIESLSGYVLSTSLTNMQLALDVPESSQPLSVRGIATMNWADILLNESDMPVNSDEFVLEQAAWVLKSAAVAEILTEYHQLDETRYAPDTSPLETLTALQALYSQQMDNGGWSLDQRGADPVMTAYVAYALVRANQAGIPVVQDRLELTLDYIEDYLIRSITAETFAEDVNWSHALALYTLSLYGENWPGQVSQALYRERSNLDVAGQAWLALAFGTIDEADPRVVSILETLQGETYLVELDSPFQTSAPVMKAFASLTRDDALIVPVMAQSVASWKSGSSTIYQNASIVDALAAWVQALAGNDPDILGQTLVSGQVETLLNGVSLADENGVFDALLPSGVNVLAFDPALSDVGYAYSINMHTPQRYWPETALQAQSGVWLHKEYCAYSQAGFPSECEPVATVENGDIIEVRIKVVMSSDREWLEIRDPLPGGFVQCAGTNQLSGDLLTFADFSSTGQAITWLTTSDGEFRLIVDQLSAGTYVIRYYMRAAHNGIFTAQPAVISPVFQPVIFAATDSMMLSIPVPVKPAGTSR